MEYHNDYQRDHMKALRRGSLWGFIVWLIGPAFISGIVVGCVLALYLG